MNKIEKFLKRLNSKERGRVEEFIESIFNRKLGSLHVKKLRGFADVFRVRVGSMRIIYQQNEEETRLIDIGRRNEDIYKNL